MKKVLFDGGLFDGVETGLSLYTELISNNTGEKLSIQSLPNSNFEDMTVRLGLKAQANKEITFSSSSINLPEGMNVLIEDRVANTLTNLTTDNYKVTLTEKVNGAGRFFIHTSNAKALSVESTQLAGVNIYKLENNILRISGLSEGKANLSLFNILGKEVVTSSLDSKSNIDFQLPKLSSGIYIVKLNTDKGSLSKKIVLE